LDSSLAACLHGICLLKEIAISTLAHNLSMKVVAEGVETKAQVDFLRQYECDFLQGFYFSEPLPSEQLVSYIK